MTYTRQKKLNITLLKLFIGILFMSLAVNVAHADIVSVDNTFTANDQYSADFHTELNRNFTQIANAANSVDGGTQIKNDSIVEAAMADEINPRIRDYELGGSGTECEMVYTGLLPTTAGSTSSPIPAGTAYVRGYRVVKSSSTAKTWTTNQWTYLDIDINGDFSFSEEDIESSTIPAVADNSIRLARVSTDKAGTAVFHVRDLRTLSCTNGPFDSIKDAASEASLQDLFQFGSPIKQGGTEGYIQGLAVSWDTHTTFKVTPGGAYINGKFRRTSVDISVPQTVDAPSTGVSGIDTGSVGQSLTYKVFAMADEPGVATLSITYGTGDSPNDGSNYRKIGEIKTDASSLFVSRDILSTNTFADHERVGAYVVFDGVANVIRESYNISAVVDNGAGNYAITFDKNFTSNDFVVVGSLDEEVDAENIRVFQVDVGSRTVASFDANVVISGTGNLDDAQFNAIVYGDLQ